MYVSVEAVRSDPNIVKYERTDANTFRVFYKNGRKAIRLYKTDIITWDSEQYFMLNSGGWHTRTTVDRMNRYFGRGIYVYSENFQLKVKTSFGIFTLFDGICFNRNGQPVKGFAVVTPKRERKMMDELKKSTT